jgi:hypothetical protein
MEELSFRDELLDSLDDLVLMPDSSAGNGLLELAELSFLKLCPKL